MTITELQKRIVQAGARWTSLNGYLWAETLNLTVIFTPEGGVLLGGKDGSAALRDTDYDLLRVIVSQEPARESPAPSPKASAA